MAGERRISALVTRIGLEGMQVHLARLVDEGVDAGHLADLAVTTWQRVARVLSPVFGQQGVSALFRRSLHLARAQYPWLEEVHPGATSASDFDVLRAVLAQREPSLVLAAHGWLLKTFCDLLARLLGEALSQKLLQPVWLRPTLHTPTQGDPS